MEINTYRLNSLEEPTDEQLCAIMEQVAIAGRESAHRAKLELERRMNLVVKTLEEYKAGLNTKKHDNNE